MARVLIVDDDPSYCKVLQDYMTHEGHEVAVAFRGEDGLTEAFKTRPDIILLDVFLPDLTGFQMCKQFRNAEVTQTTPIIMMSAAARFPNQKQYGYERGANEYLLKPFHLTDLSELLEHYLGTRRAPTPQIMKPVNKTAARQKPFTSLRAWIKQTLFKN